MNLTVLEIKNAKAKDKPYKMYDGNGLYLLVKSGGKYWRLKYRFCDKEKVLAIGVFPQITLTEAREKAFQAKKQIATGIDPTLEKQLNKIKAKLNSENSFEAVAKEWHENHSERWTKRHGDKILIRLKNDAFPKLGKRPIKDITAPELLLVLRSIEKRGAIDVANRIKQTCGQVFRYAIATGRAERDISQDLKGALKTRKKTHYASLSERDLPEFLTKLQEYKGDIYTKIGLQLLILTFVRTIELRGAKWSEIDFDNQLWKIPAERMKMKEAHIVPLIPFTLKLFQTLKAINSYSDFVFPNKNNPKNIMSENTLLYALYRMGYHSRATVHGFRATASTILNEKGFRPDVIERQLAHGDRNKVRASYNHAQYLSERREMMQWWADYITSHIHEW